MEVVLHMVAGAVRCLVEWHGMENLVNHRVRHRHPHVIVGMTVANLKGAD